MKNQQIVFDFIRALKCASQTKNNINTDSFLASRITQACTEQTLIDMAERLCKSLDVSINYVAGDKLSAFMRVAANVEAGASILQWLRRHPLIAAMIITLRNDDDYIASLDSIELEDVHYDSGTAPQRGVFQIPITARLLSPLAHGGDAKAGNATLFRRGQILSTTGQVLDLPFYAGNALRGQIRDLLADHFISALGLMPNRSAPPIALWFFHAIYAGGVLEDGSAVKQVMQQLGLHGSIRADGVSRFREHLPALSALGVALGNRVLPGRLQVADLRPRCVEWATGDIPSAQLFEWTFLTRREDHEAHSDHHGMIANTECLRTGCVLDGGIDIDTHASDLERSAIGFGLELMTRRGMLGAENRRGLGQIDLSFENLPDSAPYLDFLRSEKDRIRAYLDEIGALDISQNETTLQRGADKKASKPKKSKVTQDTTGIQSDDQISEGV